MNKLTLVVINLMLWSGLANAGPVLDEDTIEGIRSEFSLAVENADISPFEKYFYAGSQIIVDLDPSPSAGETEIDYESMLAMMEMALPMMQESEIYDELLSISIDAENNRVTIKEKTIATISMMGMKIRDVSVAETTFGVVGGEIKVIVSKDQLISTGPVQ